ncbi:hypothetical protein TYRP_022589 [Tyrophagus putrescentiae]|nr:hypothetical protein TYRP_022589 [Tyrophagus putrescentiae]
MANKDCLQGPNIKISNKLIQQVLALLFATIADPLLDCNCKAFHNYGYMEVIDTVRYMIANSPLYEGVTFNDRWQANHPGDQWDEATNEPNFGGEAVLLQDKNVLAVAETAVQYALEEGQRPVGIFADPQAETLNFINLYCDQLPPAPPRSTPGAQFKYKVMHRDPRFRTDTECLFRKNAVLTQIKIASKIGIVLRQGRFQGQQVTAQSLLNQQTIENFIRHDMESKTKEGMAMLRTLGAPTFFLTLSPVEKLCPELLVNLCKARDPASQITGAEALNMEDREKAELIANDPVTCARYFSYRSKKLLDLIETDASPFYPHTVPDYLRRTEFQHRGSPHVHTMLWTTNRMAPGEQAGPPQYQPDDPDSEAACVDFIDQYMTCSSTAVPEELLRFQKHRHTFSCRKMRNRNQETCRFGFPRFPMRATRILNPLADEQKNQEQADHLARIKAKLAEYWRTRQSSTCSLWKFQKQAEMFYLSTRRLLKDDTNINDYYRTRPRAIAYLALAQVAANFSYKKKARVAPLDDDDDDDDDDDEAHQQAFINFFGIDADEFARQPANGEANIDFEAIFDAVLADQVENDNGAEIDFDGLHDAVRGAVADNRIDVDAINDALDNADDEDDQQADVPEENDEEFNCPEERQRLEEEEPQPEQAVADGFAHLDPPEEIEHEDVSQQIGLQGKRALLAPNLEPSPRHEQYRMLTIWKYKVFLAQIALLSRRQKKILLNVMRLVKTGAPFHLFITGGARVGKSFLIECIYQAAIRYYDHQPNVELDKLKVLLCAPTGKAAFNIYSMMLYSAFGIPVSQYNGPLSADIANTLRVTLSQLKLIIIDKVSMVGLSMLSKVDTRLKQIMGVDELYGNLPVIVLGDFNQLRPVMDRFAFQPFGGDRALAGTVLWDPFGYFRLDQVMRQENAVFAQALNNLVVGQLTPAEVALFKSRVIRDPAFNARRLGPCSLRSQGPRRRALRIAQVTSDLAALGSALPPHYSAFPAAQGCGGSGVR